MATVILRDPTEAQDIVHDAVLLGWRKFGSLRDPSRFDAWFGRIVLNWLTLVAWLAILQVGLWAIRWRRSWAWALVFVAGLLQVSARLLIGLLQVLFDLTLPIDIGQLIAPMQLAHEWFQVATCLASAALLTALLIGLRPVPPKEPSAEPPGDGPAGAPTAEAVAIGKSQN
ncbi:MAG: hypothetical protein ABSB75_01650 [Candidatus Limnocylindrales bacterium]